MATAAGAQTPDSVSFRVSQHGVPIGTADVTVGRTPDGWRITSRSQMDGRVQLTVRHFDAQYDPNWQPMSLSLERVAQPKSAMAVGERRAQVKRGARGPGPEPAAARGIEAPLIGL